MRKRFHNLKKPKVRADWSKWNLYNLSRMTTPNAAPKTFFQQKWYAKSATRGFHGNQIREGQWTRMFDRRLPAVVPMDHRLLAKTDGSDQAAGRGSGLDISPIDAENKAPKKTPYMHMTYWPTERRLDSAIWRSLFASSIMQARQFVTHGFVKVNGKSMPYPGYLLNPGDMFSVDPERVMWATGARKTSKDSPSSEPRIKQKKKKAAVVEETAEDEEASAEEGEGQDAEAKAAEEAEPEISAQDAKQALKSLMAQSKEILADSKKTLSGKRTHELRDFTRSVKRTLSQIRGTKTKKGAEEDDSPVDDSIASLQEAFDTILAKIPEASISSPAAATTTPPSTEATTAPADDGDKPTGKPKRVNKAEELWNSRREAELLYAAIQRAQENPIDVRKPYATPWKPREWMSAFAFIPRYLEVNHSICSAVYLRHPVARPGLAEIPTPFSAETMELAFSWYLRRR